MTYGSGSGLIPRRGADFFRSRPSLSSTLRRHRRPAAAAALRGEATSCGRATAPSPAGGCVGARGLCRATAACRTTAGICQDAGRSHPRVHLSNSLKYEERREQRLTSWRMFSVIFRVFRGGGVDPPHLIRRFEEYYTVQREEALHVMRALFAAGASPGARVVCLGLFFFCELCFFFSFCCNLYLLCSGYFSSVSRCLRFPRR